MDYRKSTASANTETRDIMQMAEPVGNVYEMVMIISKGQSDCYGNEARVRF